MESNLMLFDSHAHLDDPIFDEDRKKLIESFSDEGVSNILNPGADIPSSKRAVQLAQHNEMIHASVGIHPHEASSITEQDLVTLKNMTSYSKVVAIGEIGLDYHYNYSAPEIQQKRFIDQLDLAIELGLPVIIHDRESKGDMLSIIRSFYTRIRSGVMHCFSGSWEMAKTYIDMGFYISLAGPVTFKNAVKPVTVAERIPLDRLLIETDSPYLTPHPYRGKRNNPCRVALVAKRIAEIKDIDYEIVMEETNRNARRLFGIE